MGVACPYRLTIVIHTVAGCESFVNIHSRLSFVNLYAGYKGSYQDILSEGLETFNGTFYLLFFNTSVRCDVIVLLSIYDVIQSPHGHADTGMRLAHVQAVDSRPTSLMKCGLGSRLIYGLSVLN